MGCSCLPIASPNRLGKWTDKSNKRTEANQGFLVSLVIGLASRSEPTLAWQTRRRSEPEAVKASECHVDIRRGGCDVARYIDSDMTSMALLDQIPSTGNVGQHRNYTQLL